MFTLLQTSSCAASSLECTQHFKTRGATGSPMKYSASQRTFKSSVPYSACFVLPVLAASTKGLEMMYTQNILHRQGPTAQYTRCFSCSNQRWQLQDLQKAKHAHLDVSIARHLNMHRQSMADSNTLHRQGQPRNASAAPAFHVIQINRCKICKQAKLGLMDFSIASYPHRQQHSRRSVLLHVDIIISKPFLDSQQV